MVDDEQLLFASASERFVFYQPLVILYCCAQSAFYSILAVSFPELRSACAAVVAGHVVLLVVRVSLHRIADQDRARVMFSAAWVMAYMIVDGSLCFAHQVGALPTGLSFECMVGVLALQMLQGFYMRLVAIQSRAVLAASACNVILWATLPTPWSVIGSPWEAILVGAGHALGELLARLFTLNLYVPSRQKVS